MKISRVLLIEQLLKVGPETIQSLEKKLKSKGLRCSRRSIYRDLELLEERFNDPRMEIKSSNGEYNRKTWMICNRESGEPETKDSYFKAYLMDQFAPEWLRKISGGVMDILYNNHYRIPSSEYNSIVANLPPESVWHSNWSEFNPDSRIQHHIREILWAIAHHKVVRITHYLHGRNETALYWPYRMIYHRGTIHLAGWIISPGGRRPVFSIRELESLDSVELTNDRAPVRFPYKTALQELAKRFGIHDSSDNKTYRVKLELGEGPYLFLSKRHWHPTQRFFRDRNGRCFMEMEVQLSIELTGWIMSWLEHVKVVKPLRLQKMIQSRAAYIHDMYGKGRPPVNPSDTNNSFLIGR